MSNIITGARAVLIVGGTTVGYCTGVTVNEEVEYAPHNPLDSIITEEHVPIGVRVTATADFTRILNSPMSKATGDGYGIMQTIEQLKEGGVEMSMMIKDSAQGGTVLYNLHGVKPQSRNFTVDSRSMAAVNMSFVATKLNDENTG